MGKTLNDRLKRDFADRLAELRVPLKHKEQVIDWLLYGEPKSILMILDRNDGEHEIHSFIDLDALVKYMPEFFD